MMADSTGSKDYMAVVVSKDSLNVFNLNQAVNSRRSNGFAEAVNAAVNRYAISGVNFRNTSDGAINFKTSAGNKTAVACIVEIDKR
jgi:citrate lyase gamma subunit